jgi:RimJ/RimL family protein N-acetyltransferase
MPLRPWQFLAYELRLDLTRVDIDALPDQKQLLSEQGLRLSTLARERERSPEALEAVYRLHRDCYLRQPPMALQRAPIPFHLWRWGSLEARDEALPEAYFLVKEGKRYVGLSTIVRLRRLPGVLECRFTGVLPEFAGRGVGLALKAAGVRYGHERGYRELRTVVLAENVAMLRINESLGFERHRPFVQSYPQLMSLQAIEAS